MTTNEKDFDCLDFKRRVQLEINKDIQGMTHEQERAYFQEQADNGPLGDWWTRVRAASRRGTGRGH